jgi:endonuclease/exonuclease/phosphatase (EEP) superfamily protein YafD
LPWRRPLGALLVTGPAAWFGFTLAHLVLSGRFWWWRPADLLPPFAFLLVPVLLAAVAFPCRRSRRPAAVLSAGALVVGASLAGLNLAGPLAGEAPVPADALRVVSWNTEFWHQGQPADDFYALLRAQRADVYLLQEYVHAVAGAPERIDEERRLRTEFPGYHLAVVGELLTLSAYPIVDQRPLDPPDAPPPATEFTDYWLHKVLRTDLLVDGEVVSVYNAHLTVPVLVGAGPGPLDGAFYQAIQDQHASREPQLRALSTDVAGNPHAVLVVGDLNTSPAMGEVERFPAGLRDAAEAHRSPYPVSWPANWSIPAWWRLDWALVSPEVAVHRYEFRDPAGLSDHRLQYLAVSL